MGKSVFKDLIREIKGSLGRFIAIMAITAIGAAFFAGVTASSESGPSTRIRSSPMRLMHSHGIT